jgi:alkyldihydroxyacetonephosphate synthase
VLKAASESRALCRDLAALVSEARATDDAADRVAYARDLWPRQQILTRAGEAAIAPPAVIVWPSDANEVAAVIRYARERGIPVVPFGAGSGVCGGILPSPSAILLDMKRMRALRALDAGRLTCRVEAGMIGQHLEDALDERGFTLGHFPSSIRCSTVGGWLAARSAGQCSGRYGKIEDMVLGLTAVDGTGTILRAERDGEDAALLPLVVGSEGVLAVVTEASLRIAPAARSRRFASYDFPSVESGVEAMRHIYQADLRPAVARLYDPFDSMLKRSFGSRAKTVEHDEELHAPKRRSSVKDVGLRALARALRRPGLVNELVGFIPDRAKGGASLVLVWECDEAIAEAEREATRDICRRLGGRDAGEEPARHWLEHRHSVSYRQSPLLNAGAFIDTMEVAATWSLLMPVYRAVREALAAHVFVMAHVSHAYPDGASIYFTFAGSAKDDATALDAYDRTWRAALAAVVGAGGTFSHHHGVGRSKAPAMRPEQGVAVDVVRTLKRVMDPAGILNPGALLPVEDAVA